MNEWIHELSKPDVTIFSNKRSFFSVIQAELQHQIHTIQLRSDPDVRADLSRTGPSLTRHTSSASRWRCFWFKPTFRFFFFFALVISDHSERITADIKRSGCNYSDLKSMLCSLPSEAGVVSVCGGVRCIIYDSDLFISQETGNGRNSALV